jgi:site-specific DNA-methyltransferase (adenine-specific)
MIEVDKIYNCDCLEGMKQIPDWSIDLIVTSPPYNIGIDYGTYKDNLPWAEYYAWCEKWLSECYRVLKKDGRIALNHYLSLGTSDFRTSPICELNCIMNKIGFKHHTIAVWTDITLAKKTAWGSYMSASSPYINSPFEGVIIDFKEQWKKQNKGESDTPKDVFISMTRGVWNFRTETKGLTKCNFSVDFASKVISLLTYKGDIVLDPFMGSATTAVAAYNLKRHFIGFELNKEYFDKACKRIEQEKSQLTLF